MRYPCRVKPGKTSWVAALSLVAGWWLTGVPVDAQARKPREKAARPTTTVAEPVVIGELRLEQQGGQAAVELRADGPLVWTQYRDPAANLVIELPNTIVGEGVAELRPAEGLVSAIEIATEANGDRPLTRLLVRTRQPAEHTLLVEDRTLSLRLLATGVPGAAPPPVVVADAPETEPREAVAEPPPAILEETTAPAETAALAEQPAAEPLERLAQAEAEPPTLEPETLEPETLETQPAAMPLEERVADDDTTPANHDWGTPDAPRAGPAPLGIAARTLDAVELQSTAEGTVVSIRGDGEFAYRTFVLENPPRFVIDLEGVVNHSGSSSVQVADGWVRQVRMAQFKPEPEPVSRVVFDLAGEAAPRVERRGGSLSVSFGDDCFAAPRAARSIADQPAPVLEAADTEPVLEEETEPAIQIARTEAPQPPRSSVEAVEGQSVEIEQPRPLEERDPASTGVRSVGGEKVYSGDPISMSLKDAEITEVLRSIARLANLNIVIQPGVTGPVTVELDRVPWDQALDQILKINRLGMQLEGNILRIAPTTQLQQEAQEQQALVLARALSVPLKTVLRRINYARASEIARLLTTASQNQSQFLGGFGGGGIQIGNPGGILSQRGSVSVDDRTYNLIINELPDYLDTVIQVIENVDIPERQVMIEARIVETTRNFSRTLGVDWSVGGVADAAHGNTTGLIFPNNITGADGQERARGGVQLLTGGANGFLNIGLGNILNTFELDVALQAAESDGLANVISAPKVATLNNQQASIQTGLQIPIQTVANNTVTVQFVNATLRLDVTPQVTAEGTVLMQINIQKREPQLAFAVVGAANAPIATREASTRVLVRDGGTAVIGGIYEVSQNQGVDKVPGLANIPIVGHLFRNRNKSNQNEELLIFITPRIIQL